jgi:hypothetical protein
MDEHELLIWIRRRLIRRANEIQRIIERGDDPGCHDIVLMRKIIGQINSVI